MSRKKLPWYKRYPSDVIAGGIGLDPAEKGIYGVFIDLCYDRHGPVVEDVPELARMSGCSTRLYRSIRDRLLEKQKLKRLDDGTLIVRGFRYGSDEFRDDFATFSTPEKSAKSTPPQGKSKASKPSYQTLESRTENRRTFKPTDAVPEVAMTKALCAALGSDFDPSSDRKNWPGIIRRMIDEDGLDFEKHILEAVTTLRNAGRLPEVVRTPAFFRPEAQRLASQKKVSAPPPPVATQLSQADWGKRITRFLECGFWAGPGPTPLSLLCEAPADLLAACRKVWAMQGNHPTFADAEGNFPWAPKAGSRGMGSDIFPEARSVESIPERGALN